MSKDDHLKGVRLTPCCRDADLGSGRRCDDPPGQWGRLCSRRSLCSRLLCWCPPLHSMSPVSVIRPVIPGCLILSAYCVREHIVDQSSSSSQIDASGTYRGAVDTVDNAKAQVQRQDTRV